MSITKTSKDQVLKTLARLILEEEAAIIAANAKDLQSYTGEDESMYDRLKAGKAKVKAMADACLETAAMEDPVGKVLYGFDHPNGMRVVNQTVPFGKILIIYESRPDVTIEAAATAFKAGNKIWLKGGKEALHTNTLLAELWHKALEAEGVDTGYVNYLKLDRAATQALIKENPYRFDLIIPRGGERLIAFVREHSNIPVIVSGRGNNFLYVGASADYDMALAIIKNGKSRISVCNALDKVLIDRGWPDLEDKLQRLVGALSDGGLEVIADQDGWVGNHDTLQPVPEAMLYEEFLSHRIVLKVIDSMEVGIALINQYSGGHSATIVTEDAEQAKAFMEEADCAAVYHNASTRFTDGGQLGMGAEIAISTQKLHARGPISVGQLVSNKWMVYGNGQVR
jgi:glutamate-5-semialdehyde dehydrogenase